MESDTPIWGDCDDYIAVPVTLAATRKKAVELICEYVEDSISDFDARRMTKGWMKKTDKSPDPAYDDWYVFCKPAARGAFPVWRLDT